MAIEVTSLAFEAGGMIPGKYTCDGENVSPPLAWTGVPSGTKSIVLISDDPDAPVGTWVHWVMFNIPPDAGGLEEDIPPEPGSNLVLTIDRRLQLLCEKALESG